MGRELGPNDGYVAMTIDEMREVLAKAIREQAWSAAASLQALIDREMGIEHGAIVDLDLERRKRVR